jgi:hypothetical protein
MGRCALIRAGDAMILLLTDETCIRRRLRFNGQP